MLHSELFIPPVTNLLFFSFHVALYPRPSPVTCHWIEGLFIFIGFISYSHWAILRKQGVTSIISKGLA